MYKRQDEIAYDDSKNNEKKKTSCGAGMSDAYPGFPAGMLNSSSVFTCIPPCRASHDSRKAQTSRGASMTPSTEAVVLFIVLHTSSNTRSCLVCRLKGKILLLPPHKKREDAHILCDARLKSQLTIRCCYSTTLISPPIRECAAGLSAFFSLCLALYVCACV